MYKCHSTYHYCSDGAFLFKLSDKYTEVLRLSDAPIESDNLAWADLCTLSPKYGHFWRQTKKNRMARGPKLMSRTVCLDSAGTTTFSDLCGIMRRDGFDCFDLLWKTTNNDYSSTLSSKLWCACLRPFQIWNAFIFLQRSLNVSRVFEVDLAVEKRWRVGRVLLSTTAGCSLHMSAYWV